MKQKLFTAVLLLLMPVLVLAKSTQALQGNVTLPLSDYQQWLELLVNQKHQPQSSYAFGQGNAKVSLVENKGNAYAQIDVDLPVEILQNEWTNVPLLPGYISVTGFSVDQRQLQLSNGNNGYVWSTAKSGRYQIKLQYQVNVNHQQVGAVLAVPLPRASFTLSGSLNADTQVSILPAMGVQQQVQQGQTQFSALVPPVAGVQISWKERSDAGTIISQAYYQGEQKDDAIIWTVDYQVTSTTDAKQSIALLPTSVTLNAIQVDGKKSPISIDDGKFQTFIEGKGEHKITVKFQVPVVSNQGSPFVQFPIPKVPVSQFSLKLQGEKDVVVKPAAHVENIKKKQFSVATTHIPLTDQVTFSWKESIPDDIKEELRLNASLYHLVHAEEGVLYGQALIDYEFTRGKTKTLKFHLPEKVQINSVQGPKGVVSDWRVSGETLTIFLSREVEENMRLTLNYEKLLGSDIKDKIEITIPLIKALDVNRQRGMAALLSGQELALKPIKAERVTKVGENQLPADIRAMIQRTIAHTYKYIDQNPLLSANTVAPERKKGLFDAEVDTLFSIGDVTLKASTTIAINVKSGNIMELDLTLPADVNVLGLTGPSLRQHQIKQVESGQQVHLDFTQEMEGQFRINIRYERILGESEQETFMPRLSVLDAEVEYGRIAIEALAALEVQATTTDQLSSLDLKELPQQLVMKTTNPILRAYRYVHVKPPYKLGLTITRHQEVDVQIAAIESANYQTLVTKDGLAVTTVRYQVRNSRKQFLKLQLPEDSDVWSVFVGETGLKPARSKEDQAILIKLLNSSAGFPVEVVYATRLDAIKGFGSLHAMLPTPDMVVTDTHWDLYLPDGPAYRDPDTNMDTIRMGSGLMPALLDKSSYAAPEFQRQQQQMLRVNVPTKGVHFVFEKLYANQAEQSPYVRITFLPPYTKNLSVLVVLLAVLGTIVLVVVLLKRRRSANEINERADSKIEE